MRQVMLKIVDLNAYYGKAQVLFGLNLEIFEGEIVGIIGPNGAGKTTFLNSISGLVRSTGQIFFKGENIIGMSPQDIVMKGISQCPEGRHLFPGLTVYENLELGGFLRKDKHNISNDIELVFDLFPAIKDKRHRLAGDLSGGEQQMVAIGRALVSSPEVLLLDEPSMGLAPLVRKDIEEKIVEINSRDVSVILVEQDINMTLRICNRVFVMEHGVINISGSPEILMNNSHVRQVYLGL